MRRGAPLRSPHAAVPQPRHRKPVPLQTLALPAHAGGRIPLHGQYTDSMHRPLPQHEPWTLRPPEWPQGPPGSPRAPQQAHAKHSPLHGQPGRWVGKGSSGERGMLATMKLERPRASSQSAAVRAVWTAGGLQPQHGQGLRPRPPTHCPLLQHPAQMSTFEAYRGTAE